MRSRATISVERLESRELFAGLTGVDSVAALPIADIPESEQVAVVETAGGTANVGIHDGDCAFCDKSPTGAASTVRGIRIASGDPNDTGFTRDEGYLPLQIAADALLHGGSAARGIRMASGDPNDTGFTRDEGYLPLQVGADAERLARSLNQTSSREPLDAYFASLD